MSKLNVYVTFDNTDDRFKAIIDTNSRWNGWERPYIHIVDVFRMMDALSAGGQWITYDIDRTGAIIIKYVDEREESPSRIEQTVKDGEIYYYFGNEGWIFEIAKNQYEDETI